MEMLFLAKQRHKAVRGFVQCDACYIPFRDASFDVVYTSRCLINILDVEMQRRAMREAFRVAKPSGIVVFIENFEEPITRMNLARKRYGSGEQITDQHNLALNLQETLTYCNKVGWNVLSIQGNTVASFVAHIIFGWLKRQLSEGLWRLNGHRRLAHCSKLGGTQGDMLSDSLFVPFIGRKGRQMVECVLSPLYFALTLLDDCLGTRLPLFGKDIIVLFRKAP